jgi:ABC-type arginine transport system ATPase subunit
MKDHMVEMYMQQMGVSKEEAAEKAEATLKRLRRWQ